MSDPPGYDGRAVYSPEDQLAGTTNKELRALHDELKEVRESHELLVQRASEMLQASKLWANPPFGSSPDKLADAFTLAEARVRELVHGN